MNRIAEWYLRSVKWMLRRLQMRRSTWSWTLRIEGGNAVSCVDGEKKRIDDGTATKNVWKKKGKTKNESPENATLYHNVFGLSEVRLEKRVHVCTHTSKQTRRPIRKCTRIFVHTHTHTYTLLNPKKLANFRWGAISISITSRMLKRFPVLSPKHWKPERSCWLWWNEPNSNYLSN